MPNGDYTNQWDEGGDYHAGWDRNQWGGQSPPRPSLGAATAEPTQGKSVDLTFFVSPKVPYVPQPEEKSLGCWAAITTMLVSWKEGATFTIDQVMTRPAAQPYYDEYYAPNERIPNDKFIAFERAMGLTVVPYKMFSGREVSNMLKKHGPVAFNTLNVAGASTSHIIVVTAIIQQDDSSLLVNYHDPLQNEQDATEPFQEFLREVQNTEGAPWVAVHYP